MKLPYFFLLAAFYAATSYAVEIPVGGNDDERIRFVDYNRTDVVRIIAHYGFQTHVEFAKGESVVKIGAGDSDAWDIGNHENHLFFKPTAPRASTNLTVVTNQRVYNFELITPEKVTFTDPRHKGLFFDVIFKYPQEEAALLAAREKAKLKRKQIQDNLANPIAPENANWEYFVQGAEEITPNAVWDDHTFTYLKFANAKEMPAVYIENSDGSESLVNTNVTGDTIIIHKTSKKLTLRKGIFAACLFNNAYDPDGIENITRTSSKGVKRYIKGNNND